MQNSAIASVGSGSLNLPPGPPPRQGLVQQLLFFYQFTKGGIDFVDKRFERYGDIYYAPSGTSHLFVLRHPDHIREVLVTRASSYSKQHSALDRLSAVLGNGLLNADGDTWRRHRRMIQPSFHPRRLAEYAEVMTRETQQRLDLWQNGKAYDMEREMMELTLRIVSQTLFSHDVSAESDTVRRAIDILLDTVSAVDVLPAWVPTPKRRQLEKALDDLNTLIFGLIDERRSSRERKTDLLQNLVDASDPEESGSSLTREEVRDELITMFLAGHETTSIAMTWSLYLLSQNPVELGRLHREIDEVLGGRVPTYDDLEKLQYTEQVISEAMRIYPPAFMLARRAEEDTQIAGYDVPAGSEVVMWSYLTHRDSRWYKAPLDFRPERFTKENAAKLPKQAYLPFGAGSRACIGKQFAMIEAKLMLASIIQRFDFELDRTRDVELNPRVTLAPKGGMKMRARKR